MGGFIFPSISIFFLSRPIPGTLKAPASASPLIGSFYSLLLAFLFSFPIGVLSAVYLELFAPRNRWLDFVEININNLAAVPSIIFGLLGLAIFINVFQMPRSFAAGRRFGAGVDDAAHHHHRRPRLAQGRALFLFVGGDGAGGDQDAGSLSSCAAVGDAGDFDRHDYRNGRRAGGRPPLC